LEVGANTFNIVVTAEDGITQKIYTLVVNRKAFETGDNIAITSTEYSISVLWMPKENAEGYKLKVYTDETHSDLICEIEFDAAGKVVNISILKSGNAGETPNFSCTVGNLSSGTTYYYVFETLGANSKVLDFQAGAVATAGEPTGVVETRHATSLPKVAGYYNILGAQLSKEPEKGVYIIKYDDGTAVKMVRLK
jgi:hypothetical protein